jgi:hypothetical protein
MPIGDMEGETVEVVTEGIPLSEGMEVIEEELEESRRRGACVFGDEGEERAGGEIVSLFRGGLTGEIGGGWVEDMEGAEGGVVERGQLDGEAVEKMFDGDICGVKEVEIEAKIERCTLRGGSLATRGEFPL